MEIRKARPSDLDRLAEIEAASYPKAEGASRASIEGRLAVFADRFWVLTEEGEIRSFVNGFVTNEPDLTDAMYDDPHLHDPAGDWQMIFSVVTDPAHRDQGFASAVLRKVINDCEEEGRKGIVLTCKERLLPFYGSFGFRNEGISGSTHGDVQWYQMRLTFGEEA